ncbi:MAG: hypothetical protein J1E07_06455 [Treponema sp.]|nr:hypothetical protein [Treponema sp.]
MRRRFFVFLSIFLAAHSLAFAQSAAAANRRTALRYLSLAENALAGGDWTGASANASLGLSYDDSVSDLIYVKAAADINLGSTRRHALDLIRGAFDKDNWAGYSRNAARILYADLLCDTGEHEASMAMLDTPSFILSADAEFIRIKNYYRIGTPESVRSAREKLRSAGRIYPADPRFPAIFFMFEYAFMSDAHRAGLHYDLDNTARAIARAYIARLPDYSDLDSEVEILASFFAEGEEKIRLLRAIDAKNPAAHPLLAIAGLRSGIYTDSHAYDLFFRAAGTDFSLALLHDFALSLNSPEVKLRLAEFLTDFSGTLVSDLDLDLQNEREVRYEHGRPSAVIFDLDCDGAAEMLADCDFGAPVYLEHPAAATSFFYSAYPEVQKVHFADEGRSFSFLHEDFDYAPLDFPADPILTLLGIDFFVPQIRGDVPVPAATELAAIAAAVELPVRERDGARAVYSSDKGKLYFANFYDGERLYAYADFSSGLPFVRLVDTDNDGFFETAEEYAALIPGMENQADDIARIFGKSALPSNFYLKKLQIDRNANTIYEYSEEYYEYGGKICVWHNDEDGAWEFAYIKSPHTDGSALVESYIFNIGDSPAVILEFKDGNPVKITISGRNETIYAGSSDDFYWVAQEGSPELESAALQKASRLDAQGAVAVAEHEGNRFFLIKVSGTVFARILPDSEYEHDDESEENQL